MTRIFTTIAAAALLSAPGYAFAASDASDGKAMQSEVQSQTQSESAANAGNDRRMTNEQRERIVASQDDVREKLSEAGFSEVRVLNAAYLVTGVSPNGEQVMMMIDASREMQRSQDDMQRDSQRHDANDTSQQSASNETDNSETVTQ